MTADIIPLRGLTVMPPASGPCSDPCEEHGSTLDQCAANGCARPVAPSTAGARAVAHFSQPPALPEITPAEVHAGVANFRALLLRAHDNLAEQADDPGVLAALVLGLEEMQREVHAWVHEAKQLLVPHVREHGIDGVLDLSTEAGATVVVRGSASRKNWDSDRLFTLIVQRALEALAADGATIQAVDPDTGEVTEVLDPDRVAVAVAYHLHECLPVTPSVGWRVTALRARGLDPATFCDEEWKPPTVTVSPATPPVVPA